MKRTPLDRHTPLKNGKPLNRRTRVNPVNRERAKKRHRESYGPKAVWIRSLSCAACGTTRAVQAAHAKSRGAGGTSEHLVPLCFACHAHQHRVGVETFGREHGFDLLGLARDYHTAWIAHTDGHPPEAA